ncbi:hypothetical protein HMI54_007786 [Coelomomyces lativittatus]|nr:hypothetical protein HMI54_007786 [Coelomomyces lativittatus]KAJ1515014.1 hypothetical protein HMI56_006885 [Coelomomyces lativittatus]KAJ1515059.1 hypothetical protein HMI55_004079 [Coelomomyces lativittatus]
MSYIHYKFRSAKDYDSILMDGMGMSAFDLKREIVRRKKLKGEDFDLILSNAESGDEFKDDAAIISRNSSIIVRRTPVPDAKRRGILAGTAKYTVDDLLSTSGRSFNSGPLFNGMGVAGGGGGPRTLNSKTKGVTELVPVLHEPKLSLFRSQGTGGIPGLGPSPLFPSIPGLGFESMDDVKPLDELSQLNEEDQLNAMFQATKYHWEATQEKMAGMKHIRPTHYHPPTTISAPTPKSLFAPRPPPPGYVCYRCGVKGHFIQDCPTNGDTTFDRPKVKRTTGIPKSFLKEIATPPNQPLPTGTNTVMMNAEGKMVQFISNEAAWKKIQSQMNTVITNEESILEAASIPNDFKCKLCNKIMHEAVVISCCHATFCDECILSSLTSEGPQRMLCPSCNSPAYPDHLQPHLHLRARISKFLRGLAQKKVADLRSSTTPTPTPSLPPTSSSAPTPMSVPALTVKPVPSNLESRVTLRGQHATTHVTPHRVMEGLFELNDLMRKRRLEDESESSAKRAAL